MPKDPYVMDVAEKSFMALLRGGGKIVIEAGEHGIIADARFEPLRKSIPLDGQFPELRKLAVELFLEMMKEYMNHG